MSIDPPIAQEVEDRQAPVSFLKFSNNQRWLASAAKVKPAYDASLFSVKIWDIATQTCIHTMSDNEILLALDRLHLFFSQDDRWFACTTITSLRIWDTTNWGLCLTKSNGVFDFSFSPNCYNAALLQGVENNWGRRKILVWDLPKMSSHTIILEELYPSHLAFSGNGEWIAVAFRDELRIYNLKSPTTILSAKISGIKVLHAASSTELRFSTNVGIVYRDGGHDLQIDPSETWDSKNFNTCRVNKDREWIVKGDERILWVPPDYRSVIAVTASKLAMSSPSGGIVFGELP
jgi:WD40 repeat protein